VRNIAEVTTAVSRGDLSCKITFDGKGERSPQAGGAIRRMTAATGCS